MLNYVHNSLIYNSQKLERNQMSLNRKMDTENVIHLHNCVGAGLWLSCPGSSLGGILELEEKRESRQVEK